ncbi:MAG: ThiF family adenylyltransferase [Nitrososphaerota archaeon]
MQTKTYGYHQTIAAKASISALKRLSVLVVGLGGLGSQAAVCLTSAGVGRIGLVDYDLVQLSNLQRQVYYDTAHVGRPKTHVLAETLAEINQSVEIETFDVRLTSENALDIIRGYDVVLDGSDNYPTRYLLSDACTLLGKPYVFGSIYRYYGQVTVFNQPDGPCYRCLYPAPPPPGAMPSCADGGVLGPLPGLVGSVQALEVLKLVSGVGRPMVGRLLLLDLSGSVFGEIPIAKNPDCPACGQKPIIKSLQDYETFCGVVTDSSCEVSPKELLDMLRSGDKPLLVDVREEVEREICRIEGSVAIPLSRLWDEVERLAEAGKVVLYCHRGYLSRLTASMLRDLGLGKVWSLKGGIEGWAEVVDPSMPRY